MPKTDSYFCVIYQIVNFFIGPELCCKCSSGWRFAAAFAAKRAFHPSLSLASEGMVSIQLP